MTRVSVIIPAYNQGQYLGDAIESVLSQTHQDFEIVVVDDGSTDDTRQVAASYTDERVQYVYQDNRGLSAARNTGMRNSTAPYLTFLDSDDLFFPDKLAFLGDALDADGELGLVAGQALPVDENGNQVGQLFDTPVPEDGALLLLGNPLHVGSVMLRRVWQGRVGFFDESLRSYEDWELWLRLAQAGCKMGWVAQPVSYYRFHTAQMTRIGRQMTTATFAVLNKVFAGSDLPARWLELRDQAYSRAYLRAAAQAYLNRDYPVARQHLTQAVELDASLREKGAETLARNLRAWLDLPKTDDKLGFLQDIYANLPDGLEDLKLHAGEQLGETAMQLAYEANQAGDLAGVRAYVLRAVRFETRWLFNRGALALLARASLPFQAHEHHQIKK